MENISQFDLNTALRGWLERLGQSAQVKAEDLNELESHVRDSVILLESKGLSSEESFLVATHRVGSPEKLEPEFAKVNRSPRNWIIHGGILAFFSVGCWFLWGMLQVPRLMASVLAARGMGVPKFTQLFIDYSQFLAVPPLLAAAYCVFVWMYKSNCMGSWMGYFATVVAVLVLLTLPILLAVLLPMIAFMDNQPVTG